LGSNFGFSKTDDDVLPGLSDAVIEDHDLDMHKIFEDKTAGFSEHPAVPTVMLKK
jgi:hypothetical protein